MKSAQKLLLATGLTIVLSSTILLAQTLSPKEIAQKTYSVIDSYQNYAFDATIVNHSDEGTNKHQVSVKVNRPNQLRVNVKGDIKHRDNYLNNGQYTVYDYDKNMYVKIKTPKSIEDALDNLFDRYEIQSPLAQLIYSNMGKRIKFTRNKNFGIMDVAGEACHYIAFANKSKEVHVWITAGDIPRVKHYRIIDKTSKIHAYKATTIYWKKASTISKSDFVFTAPKNAEEVFIK